MPFNITLDYRFDSNGFFDNPEARAAMEAAAAAWEAVILDDFVEVPAGIQYTIDNPSTGATETITLTEATDDLVIYVGARQLSGNTLGRAGPSGYSAQGDFFNARISSNFRGDGPVTDFEPWAGVVYFDTDSAWNFDLDGPASGSSDFLSVAMHEIGHILGFGTSAAFDAHIINGHFHGPNALAENGGNPIPLDSIGAHVTEGFFGNSVLMDPFLTVGTRVEISDLDKAMLADIGYQIAGFTTQGSQPGITTEGNDQTVFGTIIGDEIDGLGGDDWIQGGSGDDTLAGGAGDDTLFGQDGNDTFVLRPGDDQNTLWDFDLSDDKIRLVDSEFSTLSEVMASLSRPNFSNVVRVDIFDGSYFDVFLQSSSQELTQSNFELVSTSVNAAPVGNVAITGTPTEGQVLSIVTSGVSDADGLGAFSHQWLRDGAEISGAVGGSYTLGQADVGANISVRSSYVDGGGTTEVLTSAATAAVQNVNDAPTGGVSVSGTATEDQTLTAVTSALSDEDGLGSFAYLWFRDGVSTGVTTQSYVLGDDDVGAEMSVRVRYTDGEGTQETVFSPATAAVQNVNDAPGGTVGISGLAREDETLTANPAITDADGLGAFSYQWLRDGAAITGATAGTYTLGQDDVSARITVRVSFTDGEGTAESVTSGQTAVVQNVNDAPGGAVTVLGTAQEGQQLSAQTNGLSDEDGLGAFSYQWLRDGAAITGATAATYTLEQADVGAQISLQVGYTDGEGTAETVTSAQTAAVQNVNDAPTGTVVVTGTATEGETLSADAAGIADEDGLGTITITWLRDGVSTGETSATYTLDAADIGARLSAQASYTDGQGTAETVTSAETDAVQNANDAPTGAVTISGSLTQGETLTAETDTLDDADGLGEFDYTWLRDGEVISGEANDFYELTQEDVGAQISVVVSYIDGLGTEESVASAPTAAVSNVNDAPQGAPVVQGTATQGQTLTADTSGISDSDGLGAFQYVWLRDGSAISGATAASYTLEQADVGAQISVRVAYVDGGGASETLTSSETSAVQNVNDAPTGAVTISGVPRQGETLTVGTDALADPDGLGAYSFEWLRNGTPITGETGPSLVLTQADVGQPISVRVSYVDGQGTPEQVTSAATGNIQDVNDPVTGSVSITGLAQQDETLTAVANTVADADGLGAFSYTWLRDGVAIPGADAQTYTLVQADVGAVISVRLSFVDGQGNAESLTSAATSAVQNVNDAPTGDVTITGAAQEGATLIASANALDDADGLGAFTYRWLRDGVDTGSTGQSYVLGGADIGARMSVQVSYVDGFLTAESVTSGQTAEVELVNDAPTGGVSIGGTARQGETLSAVTTSLADLDGLGAFGYQWLRDGAPIAGANAATFTLSQVDVGEAIGLRLQYTDGFGTLETVLSAETPAVENVNDPVSGAVSIVGAAIERQVLQAVPVNIADADGVGVFTYQWLRDGSPISGATGATFELGQADVGAAISVQLRFVDGQGTQETLVSAATAQVVGNTAPSGAVLVTGSAVEGGLLELDASGVSDPDGLGAFSYQWLRDDTPIAGATGTSYSLDQDDVGDRISARVSYTDGLGQVETVTSDETGRVQNVNDAPQGGVLLSGNVIENQTLVANASSLSDADGLGVLTYAWLRDGLNTGATGTTYRLDDADVDAQISVRVRYVDDEGTLEEVVSANTVSVQNVNDAPEGGISITGVVEEGATLTAVTSALNDDDGLGTLTLLWLKDGAATGVTGTTYVLDASDIGARMSVRATYTDGQGTSETVTSAETVAVLNVNEAPEGAVVLTGTPEEGGTLMADASAVQDGDGLGAFSYVWLRDGQDTGATGLTYQLAADDISARMSVRVNYTDAQGTVETVTSAQTTAVQNVNDAPTGAVVVNGVAAEGNALTVDTSTLDDLDGLGALQIAWLRDGGVTGESGDTYALSAADIGGQISARVTYIDGQGTSETVISDPTAIVQNVNDTPQGAVSITGVARENSLLRAVTQSLSDADGLGDLTIIWQRDGVDTGARGETYRLDDADVGARMSVRVEYTDGQGTDEAVESSTTGVVSNVNDAPQGAVEIAGTPSREQVLTADTSGLVDEDGLGPFSYVWLRDGSVVVGETGATYTLDAEDVGSAVSVRVSYTDGGGRQETVQSAPTSDVTNKNDAPTGGVVISGLAREDEVLSADTSTLADADGLGPLSYTWLRDGAVVAGQSSATYALGQDDVGAQIGVVVSYEDDGGTFEQVSSAQTAIIENVNDTPTGQVLVLGSLRQGNTLTAIASNIADEDGVGAQRFVWLRNGVEIPGANDARYTLSQEDVGAVMSARVEFTDDAGSAESVASGATQSVANRNDDVTGAVTITGPAQEGATLIADTSDLSDADGLGAFSYLWFRDGSATGETGTTYVTSADDIGAVISVRVSYQDALGSNESVLSAATAAIQNVNDAPVGTPEILGGALEGETLSVDLAAVQDADGLGAFTYVWQRDGQPIAGGTGPNYALTPDDIGAIVSVVISYVDGFGTLETLPAVATTPVQSRDDMLVGDAGDQHLSGEAGDDTLSGGAGRDTLEGGPGADVFDINPGDDSIEIADFELGLDTLDLSDFDRADALRAFFQAEEGSAILRFADGTELRVAGNGVNPDTLSLDDILVAAGNLAPTGDVTLEGSGVVGTQVQADISDVADGDGIQSDTIRFEWVRDGETIVGAQSDTYALVSEDIGANVRAIVHFEDMFGTQESVSSAEGIAGLPLGETRQGTDLSDDLDGTDGPDVLETSEGDDTITGGTGDDDIDGGDGVDTATYSGRQASYSLRLSAEGAQVIDRRADGDGTDTLRDVEFLDFAEELPLFGDAPLDLQKFGGPASLAEDDLNSFIEMYIAYFNRAPDAIGLYFWATAFAGGTTLDEMTALFIEQPETAATYPEDTSNTDFAGAVYGNVLGRLPDLDGFNFWVGLLDSGAVGRAEFILEVLRGAKADAPADATEAFLTQQQADQAYLETKTDIGAYFAVLKGMSDVENARTAMGLFDGTDDSLDDVVAAIDGFHAAALDAETGEFLMTLVGVLDDPFAGLG